MKTVVKSVAVGLAALVLTSTAAVAADSKPVALKVPIAFSTSLPGLGTPIKWVGDHIATLSGGAVTMKLYEPGELVAPSEILDAVSSGKVNAGYSTAGYWESKIPAAPLFAAVPFGPEAPEFLAWLYSGNGLKLYQEMYDRAGYDVHVVPCAISAPETSGWFSKPINSPEDLKGLRMPFFGLGGKVMQKLGVSTAPLPGGKLLPALEQGTIDATEFSQPAVDQLLGFSKIVKYNYFPGWHQQATVFELLVNNDTWSGMDAHQQAVVETLCKASMTQSLAEGEAIQFNVMKQNVEQRGVKNLYWSDEMLALFKKTWDEVVAEEEAKNDFFKKVYEDLNQFRNGYALWKAYAFLPRARPR